ncbi:hypothetical protein CEXT_108151 [Caerostris extrusa]|uniref:Uncharacterized protein n=1 Tax=Caerostris extrusa TaxID=172846 RepID=A0AAV4XTF3_CAEEX|nr:hypothetical protein CEXT_108151 [Caerostris extrusa]
MSSNQGLKFRLLSILHSSKPVTKTPPNKENRKSDVEYHINLITSISPTIIAASLISRITTQPGAHFISKRNAAAFMAERSFAIEFHMKEQLLIMRPPFSTKHTEITAPLMNIREVTGEPTNKYPPT